jgi:glycosyltransferase involved in cell wall biosynthesis
MTILCPSHYLANLIIKTYHSDATKIKCFHQAIDVSMIPYKQPSKIESSVKILFVKWDFRRGGLLVLGQALGQLSQYQFELSVLGPSPHDFKGIYTFFNKFPNIKLHLEGIVSQNVFFEQLAQHDIFCIPAKAESLGLANAQALASGISVVSTNAGGIPEVMNGDENGWLALPNDINSL